MGVYETLNHLLLKAQRPIVISSFSPLALGTEAGALGVAAGAFTVLTNEIYAMPFVLPSSGIAQKMAIRNGSSVGGNIDLGIYDEDYNLLVSTGTTAQSGTSDTQEIDITDTLLPAGRYYMAVSFSSGATNRAYGMGSGMVAMGLILGDAFPLPSTLTPVSEPSSVPLIAVYFRSFVG